MGVVAIEKAGITERGVDEKLWLSHDAFEVRLADYVQLLAELQKVAPGWNGQLILIGSSEGGKIVPKLNLLFSDKVVGTILIGSGGGLPFGEEIKYQIKQLALSNDGRRAAVDLVALDQAIDAKFQEMVDNPESTNSYYAKSYKWFASYLNYELLPDLLAINNPLLIIHGVQDDHVPVESADLVQRAFTEAGKHNLTYLRYDDLGHSIGKRLDIFLLILDWSAKQLVLQPPRPVRG